MKKLLTLLMATIMMFALATSAWAADVSSEEGLKTALTTGGDYTLTADIELTTAVTIPEGVEVSLETADFTITYTPTDATVYYAIYNNGDLTITGVKTTNSITRTGTEYTDYEFTKDDGKYEFVTTNADTKGFFYSKGTLTMSDVTVYSVLSHGNGGHMIYSDAGSVYLNNVNSMSMFTGGGTGSYGNSALRADTGTERLEVYGGYYLAINNENNSMGYTLTSNADYAIISPDVVCGYRGALAVNNGYSEILGGHYSAYVWHTFYFSGDRGTVDCVIKGGTFEKTYTYYSGKECVYIANQNTNGDGGINASAACVIEGGTFNGFINVGAPLGTLSVSGGTFNDPDIQTATLGNIMNYLEEDADIIIGSHTIDVNTIIPADATVTLAESATLTVGSGKTLTLQENATLDALATDAVFTNYGAIYLDATRTLDTDENDTVGTQYDSITVTSATALTDAVSAGTYESIYVSGEFTLSSSVNVPTGTALFIQSDAVITLEENVTLTAVDGLTCDGTMKVYDLAGLNAALVYADAIVISGEIALDAATTTPAASLTIANGGSLTLGSGIELTVASTTVLTVESGGTLDVSNGTLIGVEATITNDMVTYYGSFYSAVTSAVDNDVVTMLTNVNTSQIIIYSGITIDLNDCTLTTTSGTYAALLIDADDDDDIVIKNGTVQTDVGEKVIWAYVANSVLLEDLTIPATTGTTTTLALMVRENIDTTISNCDISSISGGIYMYGANSTLTVKDGTTITDVEYGIFANDGVAGVTIDDCTVTASGVVMEVVDTVPVTINMAGFAAASLPFEEDGTGYVDYHATLEGAISDAVDGSVITVLSDCQLDSNITLNKSLTIKGATGTETISGARFGLSSGYDLTLDSLCFETSPYVVYASGNNDITINNCVITEPNLDSDAVTSVVYNESAGCNLTFTNNTVNGDYRKAILVHPDEYLIVTGNTFTGVDKITGTKTADCSSVLTIVTEAEDVAITITGNTFDTYHKVISTDNFKYAATWKITGNIFTDINYDFDLTTANDYTLGTSLAYNYFDGTLPVVLDSNDDSIYSNTTNSKSLVFYPYYSDSTMKTLVYVPTEDGEEVTKTVEEATSEALENALSAEATTEEIADAVTLVEILDNETILENDDLLEMVYSLDEALLENGSLEAGVSITTLSEEDAQKAAAAVDGVNAEDLRVSESASTEVQGLAVAIIGNEEIAEDTTVTVTLEIAQTAAEVTVVTETDDETGEEVVVSTTIAVTYDISPSKTVTDDNDDSVISTGTVANEEISAPITFTLHLPSIFDNTNRATLTHDGVDKGTYVVYHDGDDSYITVTTTHFSEFVVTLADSVSTGSSVKKYSNSLEVGDNGSAYATPLSAASGTTVYINVTPDTGYEVDEVIVDGGDIDVTDEGDGTYSYKQPAYAVDIEVTFVATDDVEEEVVEDETEALTDFEDVVAGAWYEEFVAAAVEEGIMQGNSTTEFAPNGTTTRAMMIQVLFNLEDQPETENDEAAWYSEALAWGMEFGITDGTEITGDLTREQLVTMLYRYAMSNGVDTSAAGDLTTFGDAENVADWAADAFAWAVGEGIINGDTNGNLNPDGNATRAELAKIMVSYLGL